MTQQHIQERLLTEVQIFERTGRSLPSLRRDRLFGRGIPFVKVGRQVRYRESDLAAYLESLPTFGGAPLPGKKAA
ncbi:MAG: DNA-binding protein [Acidobacteria bacterium]|nr:DNA-binding protein [Acidobacteriota bacterium]